MTEAANTNRPVLLLDFDGTVCIGDGPVWAYAEAIIADLLDAASEAPVDFDAELRARLGAFLDGSVDSPKYLDGYAAVAELAANHAVAAQLQRAYASSRRRLAEGNLDVSAPTGLAELLDDLGSSVERVLVTNAPADGVAETLDSLGLRNVIDRVITNAGKPAGWSAILPPLLEDRVPAAIMAIGDIWGNDVKEPLEAGCCTALIDRFGHRAGPAHAVARTFPELYPAVREWAADPEAFAWDHSPSQTATNMNI